MRKGYGDCRELRTNSWKQTKYTQNPSARQEKQKARQKTGKETNPYVSKQRIISIFLLGRNEENPLMIFPETKISNTIVQPALYKVSFIFLALVSDPNRTKIKIGYGVLEWLSLELVAKGFEMQMDWSLRRSPDLAA